MPYIGNTIRAADDYRLIDDISSGFDGSETSFALQVAGSAPVPFPKSPQQVLISVNGVIQEPDPTGSSGFNLVGTNIVFSSAPTNGHAFFGIIYATADYLNAGGNFPAGSLGAPSITFIGDENTGLYRKGSGSIGFVADATEIANTDSNGITISSGDLILGDNRKAKFGAGDDLQIFHDGSNSFINEVGTGGLFIRAQNTFNVQKAGTSEFMIKATSDGSVELYHDNSKKFETTSAGVSVTGTITSTGTASVADGHVQCQLDSGNGRLQLFNGSDAITVDIQGSAGNVRIVDNGKFQAGSSNDLEIFHDGNDSRIADSGTGDLIMMTSRLQVNNAADSEAMINAVQDGAVELYHDNSKKFETTSAGVHVLGTLEGDNLKASNPGSNALLIQNPSNGIIGFGANNQTNQVTISTDGHLGIPTDTGRLRLGASEDLQIYHDGFNSRVEDTGTGHLILETNGAGVLIQSSNGQNLAKFFTGGAAELYHNYSKKAETVSGGFTVTGTCTATAFSGDGSNLTGISSGAISSIANDGANRLLTSDGDGTATAHQDFNVANQRLTCRHTSSGTTYPLFLQNRTNGDSRVGIQMIATGSDISDGQFASIEARGQLAGNTSHQLVFKTCTSGGTPTDRLNIDINGNTLPGADNTYNLGSSSVRWANVFTADLKLSNKGSQNDVDSTWGNYTIQEGHEDLFLINHRTGKKFKFNLTEVS